MRMTVDQLLDQALRDVVDVPATLVGRQLRVEHHLQQHVAQFVPHRVVVVGLDRLQELVGLLQKVTGQRAVGLLGIPGAAAGAAQGGHHLHEIQQPRPVLGGRHRAVHGVGEATVAVDVARPVGVTVSLGSVLLIGSDGERLRVVASERGIHVRRLIRGLLDQPGIERRRPLTL